MRWVVALLLLTGAAFAQSQPTQPAAEQRGTEKSPVIVQIAPGPNAQDEAAQTKREKDQKAAADSRAEITTYLIAGATLIQAVALIWTIVFMVGNGRRQLRAYVHVSEAQFASFAADGIYMINYKNTGQTPALDVASDISVMFARFPLDEPLDAKGTGNKGVITLGRDGEGHVRLEAPRRLTVEEYENVQNGKSAVFVFGTIKYSDVFGKSHATTYRYYIGGDQGIRTDGFMAAHPDGNNAI
jgi:hypothetical protein